LTVQLVIHVQPSLNTCIFDSSISKPCATQSKYMHL